MADISKIILPDTNEEYNIKDATARSDKMDKANPTGTGSFSLNRASDSTVGVNSVAEGNNCTASGSYSHAEGAFTVASKNGSHAEGQQTTASGSYSHAEGRDTTASGGYGSHAEGYGSTASGTTSHAEGSLTIANHRSQHVFGEFNIEDTNVASASNRGDYVEIVGNGTSANAKSNARTLDWEGNEVLAGDLTINGTTSVGNALNTIPDSASDIPYTRTTGYFSVAQFTTTRTDNLKNIKFDIGLTQESGTPSPSSPKLITGYNSATITRKGKNFIDPSNSDYLEANVQTWGGVDDDLVAQLNTLKIGTYQVSFKCKIDTITGEATSGKYGIYLRAVRDDNTQYNVDIRVDKTNMVQGDIYEITGTFKVDATTIGRFTYCYFYSGRSPWSSADICKFYDFQIELGYALTPYEPFTSATQTISLPQTVYCGEIDMTEGSGESTHGIIDLGDMSWAYNSQYGVFTSLGVADCKVNPINCVCSAYDFDGSKNNTTIAEMNLSNLQMAAYSNANNKGRFVIKDTNYTDAETFTQAVTGQKIVFPLETPVAITISTPISLTTSMGVNNVFTNTNGNISVDYDTDTQSAIDNSIGQSGIYPVLGTQTTSTNIWTGELHGVSKLYTGLTISYVLPYAGTNTGATLELTLDDGTTTGAINCYITTGRLSNHVGVARPMILTYYPKGTLVNGGTPNTDDRWVMSAYYDSDNNAYNTKLIGTNIIQVGANGIFRVTFIMQRSDGRWESIVTSSTTATTKARNTNGFKLESLAVMAASYDYTENAYLPNGYVYNRYASTLDARYSFNVANNATYGLTQKQPVYLVGTLNPNDGLFYLDSTWWTQTLPSTEDGKLYIQVATAYDYYRIANTLADKRIYRYKNGAVREYLPGTEVQEFVDNNEPLIVNFTFADEGDWDGRGQMDITYTELLDAINNNRPIIANAVTGNTTSANFYSECKGLKFVGMVIEGQQLYQMWGFYTNYCAIFSLTGWLTAGNSRTVAPRIIMVDWLKGQTNLPKNSLNLSDFKIYFKNVF